MLDFLKSKQGSVYPVVQDPSGLLYLKFVCILFMVYIHTTYYLLLVNGGVATENYLYGLVEFAFVFTFWPLFLPATAGAMLAERLRRKSSALRISAKQNLGVLWGAGALMVAGLTLNWIFYHGTPTYHPYTQATLEFIALAFVIVWLAFFVDYRLLFLIALCSILFTELLFSWRLRDGLFFKILFAADGLTFTWPLFPWVGLVALAAGLQWRKDFFFRPRFRRVGIFATFILTIGCLFTLGAPIALDPRNFWGEGIFQHGEMQAFTLMIIYCFVWLTSSWLCERFPPRKYGLVHVVAQSIFYVYVFHLALLATISHFLLKHGYAECLDLPSKAHPPPCLVATAAIVYPVVLSSSWLVAWLICRYFINLRIRVRLRNAAT